MKSINNSFKILGKEFLNSKSAALYLLENAKHQNKLYQNDDHLEQTYSKFKDSFYRKQSTNPGLIIFKSFLNSQNLSSMSFEDYREPKNFLTKEIQYNKKLASIPASVSFHERTGFFAGGYEQHKGMIAFHLDHDSGEFYKIINNLKLLADKQDIEAQRLLSDVRASVSRIHSFWDHDASTTIQTIRKEDGSKKMVVIPYDMGTANFEQCPASRDVRTERVIQNVGGFRSYNECAFKPRYDTFVMPICWLKNDFQEQFLLSFVNTSVNTVEYLSKIYGYYVDPLVLIDKNRQEKNELFKIGDPEINKHGITQNITSQLEERCNQIKDRYTKTPSSTIKTNSSSYLLNESTLDKPISRI